MVYDARNKNIDFIIYQGEKYIITAKFIAEIENYLAIKNKNKTGDYETKGANTSEGDDGKDTTGEGFEKKSGTNTATGSNGSDGNDAGTKVKLKKNGKKKVTVPTVMTAAPAVVKEFSSDPLYSVLENAGVVISSICPLMYMNNPQCGKMPVLTCSNKLRTYTSAKYMKEAALLEVITGGAK